MLTPGKYRHLMQCSTLEGHFTILAIDHRNNLLETLNQHTPTPLTGEAFSGFKLQVVKHLLPEASALLIDPAYGIGPGISKGIINAKVGLLAPLEVTDYNVHPSQRATDFIQNWSAAKIKKVSGSGVKLLLYYHPNASNAQHQRDIVAHILDECTQNDIPLFLEPIVYSLDPDKTLHNDELQQIVAESARTFAEMGVDILKLQFPIDAKQSTDETLWKSAAATVNAACNNIPWTLLSAGVDYNTFKRQAEIALDAGASGVIVGRAVWAEAVLVQGEERKTFLKTTAHQRMAELATLCQERACSWHKIVSPPEINFDWYENY